MGITLGQAEPVSYPPVSVVYDELKAQCLTRLPPANCEGILPDRYIYYPPEIKPEVPLWFWIGLGFTAGRLLYGAK